MSWNILFFETNRGERPVKEFIKSLSSSTIAKVTSTINLLEQYGPLLNMPHSKKVIGEIYELRIRGREEVRIFYAFRGNKIILLHAFQKKSQKTPAKEIKLALVRLKYLT